MQLTHMCFADDMLVLCNGDTESLGVAKKALDSFSNVSGLFLNLNKSTIFFGSFNEGLKRDLLTVLPFKCRTLPMKYLGVPLVAKRLGVNDRKSLIENVEKRISSWRNMLLSYARRIQLIASVLSLMQQYWALVYMIPSSVFKDIDKLLKRFLWNAGDSTKGKARVAWSWVCRPKDHGGIGLKSLKKWNEVLLITHVWKIIADKVSLWVKWVNTVKLKGRNFWEIKPVNFDSWGWKNLLELRDKIGPFVIHNVGDAIFEARFRGNETVKDGTVKNKWDWLDNWNNLYPNLAQISTPTLSDCKDSVK
ncbi:RNA-directed DNA polymerase, eukaryota, reverse transcriptase zinc-binding domain protein [Tanacetum coccineum]